MVEWNGATTMDYSSLGPIDSRAGFEEALISSLSGSPVYNASPANRSKFRKALSKVNAKQGDGKVLYVGDSTSWGLYSGGPTGNCPPKIFSELLDKSVATQYTFIVPSGANAPSTGSDRDIRIGVDGALPANWGHTTYGFGHSGAWQATGTGTSASLDIRPGIECDTFEVYYLKNSGLGTLDISVDGGSVTVVDCNGGPMGWAKATITATAGSNHVLSIIKKVNTVFVFGINAYLSTKKSIHVMNAGMCSSKAYSPTVGWGTAGAGRSIDGIQFIAPDLTIIQLGINDALGGESVANWEAATRAIIAGAKISGDVILASPIPSDASYLSGTVTNREKEYQSRCRAIADDTGAIYFDLFKDFNSWSAANALGYMADTVHLTPTGSADVANAYRKIVTL